MIVMAVTLVIVAVIIAVIFITRWYMKKKHAKKETVNGYVYIVNEHFSCSMFCISLCYCAVSDMTVL